VFLRRRGQRARTRILFATDLHGSEIVFRKFLNAVRVYDADVAILGGDLTGKRIVPLVRTGESFRAEVLGVEEVARTEEELDALRGRIRDLGQYPLEMRPEESDRLAADPEVLEQRFVAACNNQVRDWMERSAERLEPLGVSLFVTGGNDDYLSIEAVLDEAPYVVNAEGHVVEVPPGVEMISTGYGNLTPWRCPRDITEEDLEGKIEQMASQLADAHHAIFNLHVPPYSSGLDLCPKLDTSVDPPKPLIGEEAPAGSRAVRLAIERFRPVLSLHGHIHECAGIRKLGPTTCVNPGSEYGEGILRSAVIDLSPEREIIGAQLLAA
jgi:Icc-related predicted phosphoesterase